MGEEAIPFVMILVPMFIAMGYDAVVGIMCSYVATQIGFGTSWQNPFGLAVAQGIAGIPVMSGAWFRIPLWIIFTGLTCVFTMRYAAKVKKNPKISVAYESDQEYREDFAKNGKEELPFTLGHKLVLLTIVACMDMDHLGSCDSGLLHSGNRIPVLCYGPCFRYHRTHLPFKRHAVK